MLQKQQNYRDIDAAEVSGPRVASHECNTRHPDTSTTNDTLRLPRMKIKPIATVRRRPPPHTKVCGGGPVAFGCVWFGFRKLRDMAPFRPPPPCPQSVHGIRSSTRYTFPAHHPTHHVHCRAQARQHTRGRVGRTSELVYRPLYTREYTGY